MHALHRRKFTDEEKRNILAEAGLRGINVTLYKHKLSYSVFSRWKKKFNTVEQNPEGINLKILQQLQELTAENERLKIIIANQALEIQIKTDQIQLRFPKPH